MSESESSVGAETARVCERCDRESRHLTKWLDPDGSEHYVCWSCSQRMEKRVNLSQRWKRERRSDATAR